jgi:Ca2+-binding EF-hand superfamily protein
VEGFWKFDKSKSGALDEAEFQQVAVELGYGEYGRDIFLANSDIDYAGVQTLNYNALLRKCCREVSSFFAKEFVQAMQWSEVDPYAMSLDNASFSFTAESPEAARLALLDLLERHDVTLHKAFQAIYEVLGYSGKRSVLEQIFAAIDWDKSGSVTFEEFHAWTINRKTRLERHSGDTKKLSLTEVRPTTPTVRRRSWVAGVVVGPSSLPVACRSLS